MSNYDPTGAMGSQREPNGVHLSKVDKWSHREIFEAIESQRESKGVIGSHREPKGAIGSHPEPYLPLGDIGSHLEP